MGIKTCNIRVDPVNASVRLCKFPACTMVNEGKYVVSRPNSQLKPCMLNHGFAQFFGLRG